MDDGVRGSDSGFDEAQALKLPIIIGSLDAVLSLDYSQVSVTADGKLEGARLQRLLKKEPQ